MKIVKSDFHFPPIGYEGLIVDGIIKPGGKYRDCNQSDYKWFFIHVDWIGRNTNELSYLAFVKPKES